MPDDNGPLWAQLRLLQDRTTALENGGSQAPQLQEIVNGTAADAGALTGYEVVSLSRGGLLSTTLQKIANFVLAQFGVSSVASLRSLNTVFFTRATTAGYYAAGDGGHGQYAFVQTGSLPADNGCTAILSNDGRGYWALLHNGTLDVKQAGARTGFDASAAFNAASAAIVAANGAITRLIFSPVSGGWLIGATQVVMKASNIVYELRANIINQSTVYQTPLIFAYDTNAQPAQSLSNVKIEGNGFYIDGNGQAILTAMGLGPGVLPGTFPQPGCNYIDGLKIRAITFKNGVYDSLQLRQCRNHVIKGSTFRDAVQYLANGLNITTNWATYSRGDYSTYGYGLVDACVMYNNASMGGTYYHCAGGVFRDCKSFGNGLNNGSGGSGSGFSYESPPGSVSTDYADGRFEGCHANNNGINGYYINTPGVIVDANCTSYGNGTLGLANDVSGLQMCGVVVSGADDVTVLGRHENNARHGVTFLGATGLAPQWRAGGNYSGNAGSGINVQGIYRMTIDHGTKIVNNGRTLVGGSNLTALAVSNSTYNNGVGVLTIGAVQFATNGARDINVGNVGTVHVHDCESYNNNDVRGSTGGTGYNFGAIQRLILHDNFQDVVGNGWTTNAYTIGADVQNAYVYNNRSNQASGTVMSNLASNKFGISAATKFTLGTYTPTTTIPNDSSGTLPQLYDVVGTLIKGLQDGVLQG